MPARSSTSRAIMSFGTHAKARWGVSRSTLMHTVLLGAPLVLVVTVLRLLEFSFLLAYPHPSAGRILQTHLPYVLLVLLAPAFVFAWMRTQWSKTSAVWHIGIATGIGAALGVGVALALPSWFAASEWFSYAAFQYVRGDVLIVVSLMGVGAVIMEYARGGCRKFSLAALHGAVLILLFLSVGAFGHLTAVGAPADWYTLKYFFLFPQGLLPVVASEVDGTRLALLLTPLIIVAAPLAIRHIPAVRRWMRAGPAASKASAFPAVSCALLPLALILTLPPRTPLPVHQPHSLYASFVSDAASDLLYGGPMTQSDVLNGGKASTPFDTDHLRLAATDSTRRMNVAFVVLESVRSRSTTPYNPSLPTTPFLDSLAERSLFVENMRAVIPHTNKSLAPIFAGLPPRPKREITEATPGGVPGNGLPAMLRKHGYRTAFFTPVTFDFQDKDQILRNLGFDHLVGSGSLTQDGLEEVNYFGYADQAMMKPGLKWIDNAAQTKRPFFAAFLTSVTHHPYGTPSSFERSEYDTKTPH